MQGVLVQTFHEDRGSPCSGFPFVPSPPRAVVTSGSGSSSTAVPSAPTYHHPMEKKKLTLAQTVFTAGIFSAVSFWYGFMFGRESARREMGDLIEDLRKANAAACCDSEAPPPSNP